MISGNVGYDNFCKLNLFFVRKDIDNVNDKKMMINIIVNNVVLIKFFIIIFVLYWGCMWYYIRLNVLLILKN